MAFDGHIEVYTDSDWAGDLKTRLSTSGGIPCFEKCVIRTWAKLQNMVALSSAEAEYLEALILLFRGVISEIRGGI